MSWWTTEQTAEYLGVSTQSIYDSRARNKFPGNRGSRRGRRIMFPSEAIEAGKLAVEAGEDPDAPHTIDDPTEAILVALGGIHDTLRSIDNQLRARAGSTSWLLPPELATGFYWPTGEEE